VAEVIVEATVGGLREVLSAWRADNQSVALVPTMGNLHRGHLSLANLAREVADRVVMTIYVNPTQFGAGEDFQSYPRTFDEDLAAVSGSASVDALFVPEDAEIYPFGIEQAVRIVMPEISGELCGAFRPGHFDGVTTVVARLLNIVRPDVLILGEKDFQQLVIVDRMVRDLRWPVKVVGGSIQRDSDGLALSSRNRYLNAAERAAAPQLHQTLELTSEALRDGERDYGLLARRASERLERAGFKVDYIEIRDAETLAKPNGHHEPAGLIVLAAAWLGGARLIDNERV